MNFFKKIPTDGVTFTAARNVRTLLEKNKSHVRPTAVVSRELDRYNIDIAALSETRVLGESRIDEVGTGYTFFLKGKAPGERHLHGVGFAVRTNLLSILNGKYPNGINERLMTVDLHLDGCILTLISAYAPTLCGSDEDKEDFYDNLSSIIKNVPRTNKLLLLGDFNARVGTDSESWDGAGTDVLIVIPVYCNIKYNFILLVVIRREQICRTKIPIKL